ncbi:MAG TPA: ABC transporter permease [Alphaproteobacteria bacterium]|nr:ABC transporter permease [Alphaproteobacteria bacterium]
MKPDYKLAVTDLVRGLLAWRVWGRLGWQEVKRRYRRTVLGPFWVTLSLGMFIGGLGLIWAPLFGSDVAEYLPFVTAGMISWTLIATIINEGCVTYTIAESLIKQLNFTLSILNWTLVWRNIIVFFHNLMIAVVVYLLLPVPVNANTLLMFPGLAIIAINGVWMSMLLGMISTRFRDVPQLVGNVVQVLMFVTPVFWYSRQLGARAELMDYNVLYHLIEVVREPLLGRAPRLLSYEVDIAMAVVGWALTLYLYARFRRRIAYWL